MIVEVDLYYQIRFFYNEGEFIRSTARKPDISRTAVKKYCEGNTTLDILKSYTRESEVVKACLEEYRQIRLPKQAHTAKRIYDRLVAKKVLNVENPRSVVR